VGAYSYSEGIETLAQQGFLTTADDLWVWLTLELKQGNIRLETAVLGWAQAAIAQPDLAQAETWNQWLSAFRETEELRSQSWQMGRSLLRLLADLEPDSSRTIPTDWQKGNCNFAIAYALVAHAWKVPIPETTLTYLYSWAANLISAAVRAVPLGQTEGQRLLRHLIEPLKAAQQEILVLDSATFGACSWGLSLASMQHETQYSRLFRS
jgi:urease accessory protein